MCANILVHNARVVNARGLRLRVTCKHPFRFQTAKVRVASKLMSNWDSEPIPSRIISFRKFVCDIDDASIKSIVSSRHSSHEDGQIDGSGLLREILFHISTRSYSSMGWWFGTATTSNSQRFLAVI